MAITNSFSSVGLGTALSVPANGTISYNVSGTFVGTWVLDRSDNGSTWDAVATGTAGGYGTVLAPARTVFYRFRCSARTSGTIVAVMREVSGAVVNGAGAVPSTLVGTVSAAEIAGVVKQTLITLEDMPQTLPNTGQYVGTKIYDFPAGRILVLGVTATLQEKTTSVIADTLNGSKTGALALGSATASSTTLNSTMADLLPSTAWVSSATINVAGTAVSSALASSAQFDGTTTALDLYLNAAVATDADLDADATITWTGNVLITWINLGDY